MTGTKKIFFITPTLERTGSEIVLFHLLKGLDKTYSASVFSMYKGRLFDALPQGLNKDHLLRSRSTSLAGRILKKLSFDLVLPFKLYLNRNKTWYLNTIVLPKILSYARRYKANCVVHTHELDHMFNLLHEEEKKDLLEVPFLLVANSQQSAMVFSSRGFKGNIEICYPFIDCRNYRFDAEKYNTVRSSLGFSSENFTWLMCGTIDENKNPELFIAIAAYFKALRPEARFVWIGDNTNDPDYKRKCLEKSRHLENLVWIHEKGEGYIDYMNACDGFVLTSQFESFSLVTLEALALAKPVIANDCKGVLEIINSDDIGKVIHEKNNVPHFCEEMLKVMDGKTIFDPVKAVARSRDFDLPLALDRWHGILEKYIR